MRFEIRIDDHSGEDPIAVSNESENFWEALDHPDVVMELEGRDEGLLTIQITSDA